jgi:hypothetical protein
MGAGGRRRGPVTLALAAAAERLRGGPGRPRKPAPTPTAPLAEPMHRLLDLEAGAAYLSCSAWTIRYLEAEGVLARVRIPLPGGGELRKLLFDRADLDRLIETWKDRA